MQSQHAQVCVCVSVGVWCVCEVCVCVGVGEAGAFFFLHHSFCSPAAPELRLVLLTWAAV